MDRRKRKDAAARAVTKGRFARAAELYAELVREDPADVQLLVRLGEVQRRLGLEAEALASFLEAGRRFSRDGLTLRAIAACKVALQLAPGHPEAEALLAELHARRLGSQAGAPRSVQAPVPHPVRIGRIEPARMAAASSSGAGAAAPARPAAVESPAGAPAAPAAPIDGAAARPPRPVSGAAGHPNAVPVPAQPEEGAAASKSVSARKPAPVPVHHFSAPSERFDELLFQVEIDVSELDEEAGHRLPEIPLFADLDPEAFQRLIDGSLHHHLSIGELAVREGERGDSLYVVVRGQLEVAREVDGRLRRLARLREGAFFGEMALLTGTPRAASVRAIEESEILEFTAASLRQLVRSYPSVAKALRRFYRQRLLANALATSPLFAPFDRPTREGLIGRFRTRDVAPGEEVVREGEPVEGLFVVLHGSLDVTRTGPRGERIRLGELREGDVFGEQSLLHGGPAGATCTARSRGMVLRLPREVFGETLDRHPAIRDLLGRVDLDRQARNGSSGGADGGAMLV